MVEFILKALLLIFTSLVLIPILGILMCVPVLNIFVYKMVREL